MFTISSDFVAGFANICGLTMMLLLFITMPYDIIRLLKTVIKRENDVWDLLEFLCILVSFLIITASLMLLFGILKLT